MKNQADIDGFIDSVKKLMEVCEMPSFTNGGHADIVRKERLEYVDAKREIWAFIADREK